MCAGIREAFYLRLFLRGAPGPPPPPTLTWTEARLVLEVSRHVRVKGQRSTLPQPSTQARHGEVMTRDTGRLRLTGGTAGLRFTHDAVGWIQFRARTKLLSN